MCNNSSSVMLLEITAILKGCLQITTETKRLILVII